MRVRLVKSSDVLKVINGLVLIVAALAMVLQYENIIHMNIYMVYIFSGVLLGLGVIKFLTLFEK
ncbi:MAG: hypothetical protein PF436_01975 [Prolixibacteraceae bacterium]|jgi:hypothetical protein|nr:hypothetical protein [Prolixibacteraceae bacterium]